MAGYFNFSSLTKHGRIYLIFLPDTSSLEVCSAVINLRENSDYQEKIMIGMNLIVENFKNVILIESFCSTGVEHWNNTEQGGALKQALVVSSPCLQKPEFQMHFQRKVNRLSVNAGYCDSPEVSEGVHESFPTPCKTDP